MNTEEKILLDFDCASLTDPRLTAVTGTFPQCYIAENDGAIRLGADGTPGGYCPIVFPLPLSPDTLSLTVRMQIESLMTPAMHPAWRGLSFALHIPGFRLLSLALHSLDEPDENGKNADAVMLRDGRADSNAVTQRITVPTDGAFHDWDLRFNGKTEVRLYTDGKLQAIFDGITLPPPPKEGSILKIGTAMLDALRGATNVNISHIRLTAGVRVDDTAVTALSVQPGSSQKAMTVRCGVNRLPEDAILTVTAASKTDPENTVVQKVKPEGLFTEVIFESLPFTGMGTVTAQMENTLPRTCEMYLYKDYCSVSVGETLTDTQPGTAYHFRKMDTLAGAGWTHEFFRYGAGTTGFAISAVAENEAVPLTVPVRLQGKFAVYVGYLPGTKNLSVNGKHVFITYKNEEDTTLNERFALADDFAGEEITLSKNPDSIARIAYVKFVSLTKEQYEKYTAQDDSANLLVDNDGFSSFTGEGHDNRDFLINKVIRQYSDTIGLRKFNFATCVTGGLNFPSKVQRAYVEKRLRELNIPEEKWPRDFMERVDTKGNLLDFSAAMRDRDQRIVRNFRKLNEEGIPHRLLADYAQKNGSGEVYVSQRMSAYYPKGNMGEYLNGPLYFLHPEWVRGGGNEPSYVHEEYRNYVHDLLIELAETENAAGITMDFGRYYLVFGTELTDVSERTRIMTDFVRRVRRDLPGGKILNARVLNPTAQKADIWGLDYKTWIKEGLVDRLIISDQGHETFFDLAEYKSLLNADSGTEIYIGINSSLSGHDPTKEEEALEKKGIKIDRGRRVSFLQFMLRAYEAYMAGADGIFLFNGLNATDVGGLHPDYALMNNKTGMEKWYEFSYPAYLFSTETTPAFAE